MIATAVGAKRLGLTHHDPDSTDNDVDTIVDEARQWLNDHGPGEVSEVFACRDYMTVTV